jgi:hypothetical protein
VGHGCVVLIKVLGYKGACPQRGDVTECGSLFDTQGGVGGGLGDNRKDALVLCETSPRCVRSLQGDMGGRGGGRSGSRTVGLVLNKTLHKTLLLVIWQITACTVICITSSSQTLALLASPPPAPPAPAPAAPPLSIPSSLLFLIRCVCVRACVPA